MEIDIPDIDDVAFTRNCHACYGTGKNLDAKTKGFSTCWYCRGNEKVLTATGERLIEFLKELGVPVTNKWEKDDGRLG